MRLSAVKMLCARHEMYADSLRQIAEILEKCPGLENELAGLLSDGADGHAVYSDPGESNISRLISFFLSTGNKLIATPDISGASGIPSPAVNNVLWGARGKRLFERHAHPTNKKVKLWKLTEGAFASRMPDNRMPVNGFGTDGTGAYRSDIVSNGKDSTGVADVAG